MTDVTASLTDAYAEFAQQLADSAREVADPLERVRLVLRLLEAGRAADQTIARVSAEAVWRMHNEDKVSYAEIGRQLGVTRARAQQLAQRHSRG